MHCIQCNPPKLRVPPRARCPLRLVVSVYFGSWQLELRVGSVGCSSGLGAVLISKFRLCGSLRERKHLNCRPQNPGLEAHTRCTRKLCLDEYRQ